MTNNVTAITSVADEHPLAGETMASKLSRDTLAVYAAVHGSSELVNSPAFLRQLPAALARAIGDQDVEAISAWVNAWSLSLAKQPASDASAKSAYALVAPLARRAQLYVRLLRVDDSARGNRPLSDQTQRMPSAIAASAPRQATQGLELPAPVGVDTAGRGRVP